MPGLCAQGSADHLPGKWMDRQTRSPQSGSRLEVCQPKETQLLSWRACIPVRRWYQKTHQTQTHTHRTQRVSTLSGQAIQAGVEGPWPALSLNPQNQLNVATKGKQGFVFVFVFFFFSFTVKKPSCSIHARSLLDLRKCLRQ